MTFWAKQPGTDKCKIYFSVLQHQSTCTYSHITIIILFKIFAFICLSVKHTLFTVHLIVHPEVFHLQMCSSWYLGRNTFDGSGSCYSCFTLRWNMDHINNGSQRFKP